MGENKVVNGVKLIKMDMLNFDIKSNPIPGLRLDTDKLYKLYREGSCLFVYVGRKQFRFPVIMSRTIMCRDCLMSEIGDDNERKDSCKCFSQEIFNNSELRQPAGICIPVILSLDDYKNDEYAYMNAQKCTLKIVDWIMNNLNLEKNENQDDQRIDVITTKSTDDKIND